MLKNVAEFATNVGDWLLHHLTGRKTATECMIDAFKKNPDLYENLRVTQGRRFPTADHQLMIFNTEEGMAPVAKKTFGFCYGHATMRFYVSRLAFFDSAAKFEALPKFPIGSHEWIEFYYKKIEKMNKGYPQVIPGFANLREFSEHPALNNWFKRQAVELWADRAAHVKNIYYRESSADMTREYSHKLVANLKERIDRGYNPIIMFDENANKLVDDEKGSLHVVTVVGLYQMKNNRTALVILDDKKPFPDMYDVVILNHKGANGKAYAYFDQWRWKDVNDHSKGAWDTGMGTVNQIRLVTEGDREAMKMSLNLAAFCKERPQLCAELGDNSSHAMPWTTLPKAHAPYKDFEYLLDANGNPLAVE